MRKLAVGEKARDFKLPGVDGKNHTLFGEEGKHKAVVVVFTCNHCPYAQAYEDRLIAIQNDYGPKQVRLVAINANDSSAYPEDSFEQMKVRTTKKKLNYLYLRDELQVIAKAYGAECTPEVYLFDPTFTLRYNGRIDDNWQHPEAVKSQDLRKALDNLLKRKSIDIPQVHAVGCSIKWKF
ncbi:MAG: thioredoxin family protein [Verrucomicrobiae bacterium]|nr:thioredoxin family protein [Verrucomicrobiae bacterium]